MEEELQEMCECKKRKQLKNKLKTQPHKLRNHSAGEGLEKDLESERSQIKKKGPLYLFLLTSVTLQFIL